jgi:hypothetical protein
MNDEPFRAHNGIVRGVAIPAMAIALANLAALGLMIGMVGASRAFSVGVHTLFRDYLAAVVLTLAATAVLAFALGRGLRTAREILLVIGFAIVADLIAALAVTLVFDEMRRAAEIAIPRAVFTETVGGLQLLAVGGGAALGSAVRRVERPE